MAVSKTADESSILSVPGSFSMACISTDRLGRYERLEGGSIPSMPTIFPARGAVDSADVSETEDRWFDSIRAEFSGQKLNWTSMALLMQRMWVQVPPGRFSSPVSSNGRRADCESANLDSSSSIRDQFVAVAKTGRHLPAKQTMRRFNSGLRLHLTAKYGFLIVGICRIQKKKCGFTWGTDTKDEKVLRSNRSVERVGFADLRKAWSSIIVIRKPKLS